MADKIVKFGLQFDLRIKTLHGWIDKLHLILNLENIQKYLKKVHCLINTLWHLLLQLDYKYECHAIYSDSSKDGNGLASADFIGQHVASFLIPSTISIFSAEANTIRFVLKFGDSSDENKFMIRSDSLSWQLTMESGKTSNYFIPRITEMKKKVSLPLVGMSVWHGCKW